MCSIYVLVACEWRAPFTLALLTFICDTYMIDCRHSIHVFISCEWRESWALSAWPCTYLHILISRNISYMYTLCIKCVMGSFSLVMSICTYYDIIIYATCLYMMIWERRANGVNQMRHVRNKVLVLLCYTNLQYVYIYLEYVYIYLRYVYT